MASPVVTTAHITGQSIAGSSKGYQYIAPIFNKYQRWYFNHSDLVFAVSPDSKKFLSTQGITPPIHVFPNPIDTTFFYNSDILREKGREYLKIRHDTFVVLSVGYFQTRKGIYDFIEVAKQHPQYTFVWVGGKSFGMSDVRLHTLPKNLLLVGTIPYSDLPEVYNAADLFFFPSYQENGSMAILEAAACGVPLLLRDLPSYKTLYKTGYAVGETIDEFVSKIQELPQKIKRISMSHRSL
jgi:1,2-diacylglycerol-3-alpha-glucose alpha-1,2-galactosyltransferase